MLEIGRDLIDTHNVLPPGPCRINLNTDNRVGRLSWRICKSRESKATVIIIHRDKYSVYTRAFFEREKQ